VQKEGLREISHVAQNERTLGFGEMTPGRSDLVKGLLQDKKVGLRSLKTVNCLFIGT
jgi:hypothetical protein